MALSRSLDNAIEREIRAMVMGKKVYLFCQTDEACERASMMYSFFGACKVKGKNPERWLAYVLDLAPKMKIYTNCFLSFGKTLNESTLIYEIPGEVLADVYASAGLNVIHSTEISAQWGALQSYKVFLRRQ